MVAETGSSFSQLHAVSKCPLCGSCARDSHSTASPNLYSEKLAALSGMEESALVDAAPNVQCRSCGLIYKSRWFARSLLEALFHESVPWHPKGWDAISDRFTPENFFAELERYQAALRAGDRDQSARWRRALLSIVDSIPAMEAHPERTAIESAIEDGDCDAVRNRSDLIRQSMTQPAPFKRFAGFRSTRHVGLVPVNGSARCAPTPKSAARYGACCPLPRPK